MENVSKQAREVIFSRKKNISNHPAVFFNNLPTNKKSTQKHLINLLRKLNLPLPGSSLLIIHKSFIRPHLDHGDIVYNEPNNSSLSKKIESLQYNAA